MGVFRLFHGGSRILQEFYNVILEYVMEVPMVFLGSFFQNEFARVNEITSAHKSKYFLTKIS